MESPALQIYRHDAASVAGLPVRGVSWVLRWAAGLTVLAFAVLLLTTFVFQLSAEFALRRAATAGLREAALPRATRESVAAVVRQNLGHRPSLLRATQLQLLSGGAQVRGPIAGNHGPLSLSLSAAAAEVVPRWLAPLAGDSVLRAKAERPPEPR